MTNLLRAGRVVLMLLCAAAAAAEARADVKIKSRQTMQGQTYENATYIKGKRQRTEQMGGQSVTIQQCDLRRDLQLMPAMKAYTVNPYDTGAPATNAPASGTTTKVESTKGGVVNMTITTKDTGERKQMFGHTARHLIVTTVMKSSPDSCNPVDMKMETDGWYIDAAFQLECDMERAARYYNPQQAGGCRDRYETKTVGAAKRGFPLWEKMTMFDKDGRETMSWVNEVVELSQATLDPALFEAPADYREVKDFSAAAMMSAQSGGSHDGRHDAGANGGSQPSSNSGTAATVRDLAGSQPQQAPAQLGAKKPGVIRLGLADVKAGAVADGMSASDLAAAVRNTLAEYLKSPAVELVRLEAKLPSQVEAEARQKECDFVVYAGVTHKKGGGGFGGMFGKVVAPAVGHVGYGHTGSTAGNVAASAATTAVINAGTVSANVKQKDELTLDIRLVAPGASAPAAARQFKSKAKSAGEDIITPAVEQAAQLIIETVN
jgi:hypothetical protein